MEKSSRVRQVEKDRADLCEQVMQAIDDYIVSHDIRGLRLDEAACDVCDGWVTRGELQPLLDARRLRMFGRAGDDDAICGAPYDRYWTVGLTVREMQRRYADRMTPVAAVARMVKP